MNNDSQVKSKKRVVLNDMDNAMYCKIEKGDHRTKRKQIPMIAEILQDDLQELLTLWLADKVTEVLEDEKSLAGKALEIVNKTLKK